MKKKPLLEKVIEQYLRTKAKAAGYMPFKFTSPQRRSVPDQMVLGSTSKVQKVLESKNVHMYGKDIQDIMAACITFVECKREGGYPTEAQIREHMRLRERGFTVHVVDSKEAVNALYDR